MKKQYLIWFQRKVFPFLMYIQVNLCQKLFASTNPQFDDRLLIKLQVQFMKIPCSNLGRTCCVKKLFLTFRAIFVHNMFSPSSAKRRAYDKDLPVILYLCNLVIISLFYPWPYFLNEIGILWLLYLFILHSSDPQW
jgi:hypothetical protein